LTSVKSSKDEQFHDRSFCDSNRVIGAERRIQTHPGFTPNRF
jgi:hypothetical protein